MHSVKRYSICPLTERKSSSAHAAISAYSFAESRRGICFLALSFSFSMGHLLFYFSPRACGAGRHNGRRAARWSAFGLAIYAAESLSLAVANAFASQRLANGKENPLARSPLSPLASLAKGGIARLVGQGGIFVLAHLSSAHTTGVRRAMKCLVRLYTRAPRKRPSPP